MGLEGGAASAAAARSRCIAIVACALVCILVAVDRELAGAAPYGLGRLFLLSFTGIFIPCIARHNIIHAPRTFYTAVF